MMVGVAFGVQLITYIQHWGLGDDSIPDRIAYGRGWEEDCRFQAWVTLSISLHDQHHRDSRRPYYRLELSPDSPRLTCGVCAADVRQLGTLGLATRDGHQRTCTG